MKKILIAARELDCGGTEVAMLNLLNSLDDLKFDITLILARKRGVYLSKVPKYVKIIEIPFINEFNRYYVSDDNSLLKNKIQMLSIKISRKLMRGLDKILKKANYNIDIYSNFLLRKTKNLNMEYDLAIDFYGYGCFQSAYIAQRVKAKNKLMWIHDERLIPISRTRCHFDKYTHFFGVSQACVNAFMTSFPETKQRVSVFYNIIDNKEILKKSTELIDEKLFNNNKFNIVTVGRLEWQKGYDLAIEVANELDKRKVDFCWYVIGEGSYENDLREKIKNYGLEEKFILLGRITNPYPYISKCNLYVQTSRHEGYGLAIAEARILNKAIVSSDLECVREQITNGHNGYLVPFNVNDFTEIINKLYKNTELIKKVNRNLMEVDQTSNEEIDKLMDYL